MSSAGFIAIFCERQAADFQRAVLLEMHEAVWKQRQRDCEPPAKSQDGVAAGILRGA